MRIIGIDPGTATTGFSIIDFENGEISLKDYGCIVTSRRLPQEIRLKQIADDTNTLIKKWKPRAAAVEKLFFKKNIKTALKVSEARGVILQKLSTNGITISQFTPLEIKSSVCGNGKADKKMVQQMVKLILGMKVNPKPDDAADAIAAAICLAHSIPLQEKIIA
ncbi:crossover junction endodeoxyribonuclease RuvC [Candidatus Peregrinibacteria bacterium]|nr:crossover junction endodeoxyribonuclease RuvC [Candidatus Peregrinibacteria bacterium]